MKITNFEIRYSPELAEIVGIMLGDGCLYLDKKNKYHTIIVFNKKEFDYLNYVKSILEKYFYPYCFGIVNEKNQLRLQNVSVNVGKFLLKIDMKVGNKIKNEVEIPNWIFEKNLLIPFIRGFFDTDGCIYKKYGPYVQIQFKLGSYSLIRSIRKALIALKFNPTKIHGDKDYKDRPSWKFYLSKQAEVYLFFEKIKPSNHKHVKRFNKIKKGGDAEIRTQISAPNTFGY